MKNYEEKEKKLHNALKKLSTMSNRVVKMNNDINSLNLERNQLLGEKEESEKRQLEFKDKTEIFIKNLEVDETLGQLLVAEGFSSIDDIKEALSLINEEFNSEHVGISEKLSNIVRKLNKVSGSSNRVNSLADSLSSIIQSLNDMIDDSQSILNDLSNSEEDINQLREKIGVMFGNPETTTGGNALKFYASVRIDIRRSTQLKDTEGGVLGNKTRVKIVKNKVAPPFKTAEFDIMYGEGISKTGEVLDIGVELDIIEKSGSWFSYGGSKLGQGRDSVKSILKDNPELLEELEQKILEQLKSD